MANLSLGAGDETKPNLLSGAFGLVRTGGGTFAFLSAGAFIKLTPLERRKVGNVSAGSTFVPTGPFTFDPAYDPEVEITDNPRG